jgi:toxin ParE1/3/4
MKVRYTPAAQDDIVRIYSTIATDKPTAAQKVEDRIRATCERLGSFPRIGATTDLEDVRRMPLVRWPYTIFYRIVAADDAVDVLRVVHGASVKNLDEVPKT